MNDASFGIYLWKFPDISDSNLNSLPNDKIFDQSKFKAHAEDQWDSKSELCFRNFRKVENILGKGENAGYQYFLFFPQCFQKASCSWVVKSRNCKVELKLSKVFGAKLG